jgi:hypothetical protein
MGVAFMGLDWLWALVALGGKGAVRRMLIHRTAAGKLGVPEIPTEDGAVADCVRVDSGCTLFCKKNPAQVEPMRVSVCLFCVCGTRRTARWHCCLCM